METADPVSSGQLREVELQLPASSSNCGPGFDTLSIGLAIYNFCRVSRRADGRIEATSAETSGEYPHMVREAAAAFFKRTGVPAHGFDFEIWGEVPSERGLGSSATVRGGVVAGLNALAGRPLGVREMVGVVARLDNAPDNAAALLRGGFCVSRLDPWTGDYVDSVRFPVNDDLRFVVASPEIRVRTVEARKVLPARLDFPEVVQSLNSLAYLVAIFAKGEYHRLSGSTTDHIHQPFRRSLNPFVDEAVAAGVDAGAYTGWLSGSGSSVVCAAPDDRALHVREALVELYRNHGIQCRAKCVQAENEGFRVLETVP